MLNTIVHFLDYIKILENEIISWRRPLVTPVNVRGEALGHVSSSSQSPATPPRIHSPVIVVGWGINPL